ncbi:MAG TPA: adenylate/guanylate cyclase domain-containing protein [Thermohalobaculum sp.]|nr:adenylate/guanylate cyclase domain-containing protein [Thermohalobaculum sp.]
MASENQPSACDVAELARRLELAQAAEHAMGEVIQIIARSAGDLDLAMAAILDGALSLCEAQLGILYRYDSETGFRTEHMKGVPQAFADFLAEQGSFKVDPGTGLGRIETRHETVNIPDVRGEDVYLRREPLRVATVELGGARSFLAVPMLAGEQMVGALTIYRQEVRPFSDKDVHILQRFADQSVVALENARLIHEARALSDQLHEMNRSLQQRVEAQVAQLERLSMLRRFLPDQVAELVLTDGKEDLLSSHRRKIAALFCDLRGFTAFSETAEPEEVMEVLEEFHSLAGKVVSDHGGTITHRAGDGLMVVLNDPLPVENAADAAVRLAVSMRRTLVGACQRWRQFGFPLGVGIGIATGYATLGLVGSAGRYDYTAVGTVVNMASRLCNEASDGEILTAQRLVAECTIQPNLAWTSEREITGVSRPVTVCAIDCFEAE